MTDEFRSYRGSNKIVRKHEAVTHSKKEYVHGIIHTNFAESFFSLLKRGVMETFHHISATHMQRYLDEFDFRWSNRDKKDDERMQLALKGSDGKRLMLREPLAHLVR